MKIATWNVNSIKVRLDQVLQWLDAVRPDVLAIQETKSTDENFPKEAFVQAGYQVVFSGQKTYNGVAVVSKKGFESEVETGFPDFEDPQRRVLAVTVAGVRIVNLYVPNGSSLESDKYPYKLKWLKALQAYLKSSLASYPDMIVLGDFNIAPRDCDVHDPAAWEGGVLVSAKERDALQAILDLGFVDTFQLFPPGDEKYTWWDYRGGGFQRNNGLRIDLILSSSELEPDCLSSTIHREPRTWERPSDHAPALLKLDR